MATNPSAFGSGATGPAGGALTGTYPNPTLSPTFGLILQATTGAAGFNLQNATPNILTWTPPNDGLLHRFLVYASLVVTLAETGGTIATAFNDPGGTVRGPTMFNGTQAAGFVVGTRTSYVVQGGQPVIVQQTSALTAGAATMWAEIWGS